MSAHVPVPRQEKAPDERVAGVGRDLTRYLCAAAYLDPVYARQLVERVSAEPYLAVAPSPACDVPVVLRHAYAANARRHARDLVLAVLLLLIIILGIAVGAVLVLLLLLASWATVFGYELSTRYGATLRKLRDQEFDPAAAPAAPGGDIERRIREVGEYAKGNVRVYSGYSPFTGYGIQLNSWSFTLDVSKPAVPGTPPADFDVADLYARAAGRVAALGLPAVTVEELLFVDGRNIIDDERFLPDPFGRPSPVVPPELVDDLKRTPEDKARPYVAVHATGWDGDLVVSMFVRFARHESVLFVEAAHTVLCPLLDRYKIIDTLPPVPAAPEVFSLLGQTLPATVVRLLSSPAAAIRGFSRDFGMAARVREQDRAIGELFRFNYGARISVRQQASDSSYHRYFQKQDNMMVMKAAERSVLDMLIEFTEEHGIDAEELIRSQETIFNYGIIATGEAQVRDSAVASGQQSRVTLSVPVPRPQAGAGARR